MGIVKETRESAPYEQYPTINHIRSQVNKKKGDRLAITACSVAAPLIREARVDGELFCKNGEFVV